MFLRLHAMPPRLRAAALQALDAEAIARRSPRSVDTIAARERVLHGTQEALHAWSRGLMTEHEAIARIEELLSREDLAR